MGGDGLDAGCMTKVRGEREQKVRQSRGGDEWPGW